MILGLVLGLGCADDPAQKRADPDTANDTADPDDTDVPPGDRDEDGDGIKARFDCDDDDPDRSPKLDEICDGIDNDCDDDRSTRTCSPKRGPTKTKTDGARRARPSGCARSRRTGCSSAATVTTKTSGTTRLPTSCATGSTTTATTASTSPPPRTPSPGTRTTTTNGYGLDTFWVRSCVDQTSNGFALLPGDCDDERNWVYPDAEEMCDGQDTDCDPQTEEDGLVSFSDAFGRWSSPPVARWRTTGSSTCAPAPTPCPSTVSDARVTVIGQGIGVTVLSGVDLQVTDGGELDVHTLTLTGGATLLTCTASEADLWRVEVTGATGRAIVATGCPMSLRDGDLHANLGGAIQTDSELTLTDNPGPGERHLRRWRRAPAERRHGDLQRIRRRPQRRLLGAMTPPGMAAAVAVTDGGTLVLSTCDLGEAPSTTSMKIWWFATTSLAVTGLGRRRVGDLHRRWLRDPLDRRCQELPDLARDLLDLEGLPVLRRVSDDHVDLLVPGGELLDHLVIEPGRRVAQAEGEHSWGHLTPIEQLTQLQQTLPESSPMS